jgi:tRNA(Ile)-lysidine synthase
MRGARPLAALEALLAERAALAAGETVVAASSGGPDSTALAALLARAARAAGAAVVLAHVAHGVRPEGDQDEAVVLATGTALRTRVLTRALPPGPATEARLREGRYAALAEIARTCGARRIFTAHHAEDQTETVLLALFRGTGLDGLAAMPPERELAPGLTLVRPLLEVEPAVLRRYCEALNLAYALDATNLDPGYRRNAVRTALVALRESFPHLDAAVARCAAIVREERAGTPRAELRARLRAELAEVAGEDGAPRDVSFERLDAAARALEEGQSGRYFLRRGVELVVDRRPQ